MWIHGGAFTSGAGSVWIYDGSQFARNGSVLVTINYRLSADGFLLLDGVTPNLGLLGQIAPSTGSGRISPRLGATPTVWR